MSHCHHYQGGRRHHQGGRHHHQGGRHHQMDMDMDMDMVMLDIDMDMLDIAPHHIQDMHVELGGGQVSRGKYS